MKLSYGFSSLLVSLLCATSLVDARPTPGTAGSITLPLRAVQAERSADLHPHIRLQQHMNRAIKRHARMTGRELPSELELRDNIVKRALALEAAGAETGLAKRLYTTEWQKSKIAQFKASGAKGKKGKDAKRLVTTDWEKSKLAQFKASKAPAPAAGKNTLVAGGAHGHDAADLVAALTAGHGHGHHGKGKGKAATAAAAASKPAADDAASSSATAASSGVAAAADAAATTSADASAATDAAGTDNGDALANSTADQDGQGFLQVNLDAANAGGLTAANTPTTDDSLGLDIEANDIGYVASVKLGTPPREFKILMDSGSADFWVGAENCVSQKDGGGCGNHTFLGTQSSSTFVDTKKPFEVTYGSGNVKGDIITDNVDIGGLKLNKHTFGVATSESDDFANNNTPFDGLMGLAQSALSQQGVATPPEALAAAGTIADAIVGYKISRLSDNKNDGEITFGAPDTTKFDPNTLVTFDNVNKQGFWEGDFSISVDGTDIGLAGRTAILDTGTSLILAPPADVAAFHDNIPGAKPDGQGGFTIPCTTSANVAFTFAGTAFEINPLDLLFVPVDQNNLTGDCVSAVSSGQIGGATEWLVGDVFLKNAYFVTDVAKNQISLAKLV